MYVGSCLSLLLFPSNPYVYIGHRHAKKESFLFETYCKTVSQHEVLVVYQQRGNTVADLIVKSNTPDYSSYTRSMVNFIIASVGFQERNEIVTFFPKSQTSDQRNLKEHCLPHPHSQNKPQQTNPHKPTPASFCTG